MINRTVTLDYHKASIFFWGPRQTGKSTLLRETFPEALYYDLLSSGEFRRLSAHPDILREECLGTGWTRKNQPQPVIIDEIQKLPELLDEVHSLISRHGLRFILTGSSPRKLVRGGGNLLGGRAVRRELFPLTSREIPDFSLERALNHGLLPPHYLAENAQQMLQAYVGMYLREEILAEALTRNLPAFQRFLEVASFSNGQIVNYSTIAREVGVSSGTIRGYFEILTDTLIGCWAPAWQKRAKRRVIQSPRFYFFDVGLVKELSKQGELIAGSTEFGRAFEHFIFMELRAHSSYSGQNYPIRYWHTASGLEIDFILGDNDVAIEVKSSENPTSDHLKGLRAFREEYAPRQTVLISRVKRPRRTDDGIEILPWQDFLKQLWNDGWKIG
jgi:predicted AAA+ superfamily ATPase